MIYYELGTVIELMFLMLLFGLFAGVFGGIYLERWSARVRAKRKTIEQRLLDLENKSFQNQ